MKIKTALISAFHKKGIATFALDLIKLGVETIYGSKGTIGYLQEAGVTGADLIDVATIVGEPILGHRVVTLSREVHAALLATYVEADLVELERLGLPPVDLVCVDMYPLESTVNDPSKTLADVLEKMDIGGPTMLSSGSKGQRLTLCDPDDRQTLIDWMKAGQPNEEAFREELGSKADFEVSRYRMLSATYRSKGKYKGIFRVLQFLCKYGENAWQKVCGYYDWGTKDPLAIKKFVLANGIPPSHNTIADLEKSLQTITHIAAGFDVNRDNIPLIAVVLKHGNACGAAIGKDKLDVLKRALRGDPIAAIGGELICNFELDDETVAGLSKDMDMLHVFLDFMAVPKISSDGISALQRPSQKCRFLVNPALGTLAASSLDTTNRIRYARGGDLEQPNYTFVLNLKDPRISRSKYAEILTQQEDDLIMAWAIGSTSSSNTITLVKNGMLIANAVGQQDRVGAAHLAIWRANRSKHSIHGSVGYSDSFYPFDDAPKVLIAAEAQMLFSSTGSMRDKDTIVACEAARTNLVMMADSDCRGFYAH